MHPVREVSQLDPSAKSDRFDIFVGALALERTPRPRLRKATACVAEWTVGMTKEGRAEEAFGNPGPRELHKVRECEEMLPESNHRPAPPRAAERPTARTLSVLTRPRGVAVNALAAAGLLGRLPSATGLEPYSGRWAGCGGELTQSPYIQGAVALLIISLSLLVVALSLLIAAWAWRTMRGENAPTAPRAAIVHTMG